MFEFLANLTNYKPKDFKGKTVQEILAMKPKNVGADFFEPANDQAIADAGLMGEQLDAIELLRDLKEKTKIFERCYKNKTQRRKPVLQKKAASAQQAPAEQAQQIEEPEQTPAVEEVTAGEQALAEQATADQYQAQQGGGGRRRHRKSKKHRGGHKHSDGRNCSKKHKHSGHKHKHSGHKHSGHKHKHSGHKHIGGHKHSKKHGKKNYKGGAADMTPVVFVPALTRPPPQFRM